MSEVKAAAERVLEIAQTKRPLFADVRAQRLEGVRIFLKEAWEVERIFREGLGLRVLTEEGVGFASSPSFADEDSKALVESAFGEVGRGWLSDLRAILEAPVERARVAYSVERRLDELSLEQKRKRLAELLGRLEGNKKLRYHDHLEERVVMNSEGTLIEAVVPTVQLTIGATLPPGSFLRRFGRRGGLDVLLGEEIERFFQDFKTDQELLSKLKEVHTDEDLPVLLDPSLLGMIMHDIGHAFEADFVLADGTWVADKLNKRIGPDFLQVVDDPTLPDANASYAYDDEGSRARRTVLIDRGVLKSLLHSRFTAPLFGAERPCNARTFWATDPPLVRMSNTVVAAGDASKEELLRAEKRLIFLKGARYTEISDHRTGEFKIALEGVLLIEDGGVVGRLTVSSVAGNAQEFLKGLIALGSESEFTSSTCGKWGPENTLALVGQMAPYALVARGRATHHVIRLLV
jgi:TldD protein